MVESQAAFARRKGWNRSTVSRYARTGKVVLDDQGMVKVEESEARLVAMADPVREGVARRHQRERARKGVDSHAGGAKTDPDDSTYELLQKHRAETEAARAELLRLELAEKEGKLGDLEAVRRRALQVARQARDAVLNLRFRLDPLLAGEHDAEKRAEVWDRELRAICDELARGASLAELVTDGNAG